MADGNYVLKCTANAYAGIAYIVGEMAGTVNLDRRQRHEHAAQNHMRREFAGMSQRKTDAQRTVEIRLLLIIEYGIK